MTDTSALNSENLAARWGLRALFWVDFAGLFVVFLSRFDTPLWSPWAPPGIAREAAFVGLAGLMATLWFLERGPTTPARWLVSGVFGIGFIAAGYYFSTNALELLFRPSYGTIPDLILGILLFAQVTFLVWRFWGLAVASVAPLVMALAYFADDLPEPFTGPSVDVHNTLTRVAASGMFGNLTPTASYLLWALVVWGVVMGTIAGPPLADGLARILRRTGLRSGPALGAIVTTSVAGSVFGAGAANSFVTGPLTIPMLRQAGYERPEAAAFEAIGTAGAALTPPIMGSVAFIMADLMGVSYGTILLASLAPAGLWYASLAAYVIGSGQRRPAPTAQPTGEASRQEVLSALIVFLAPVATLIGVQYWQSIAAALAWAWVALLVAAGVFCRQRLMSDFPGLVYRAAFYASGMSLMLVVFSVVIDGLVFSSLLTSFSLNLGSWAGESLLGVSLIMIAVGLVLGGALPSIPVFVIMWITFFPTLSSLGADEFTASYAPFFAGVMSIIIPPLAVGAVVASIIAEANYWQTLKQIGRAIWPVALFPTLFLIAPELLIQSGASVLSQAAVVIATAIVVVGVQLGNAGWLLGRLPLAARVALIANYGLLITALHMDIVALGMVAVVVVVAVGAVAKLRPAAAELVAEPATA